MDTDTDSAFSREGFDAHLRSIPFGDWKAQIGFCREFIERLEKTRTSTDTIQDEACRALAIAYLRLAEIYERRMSVAKSTEALDLARKYAEQSSDKDTMYTVLAAGGECLGRMYTAIEKINGIDIWNKAVEWLQSSVSYLPMPVNREIVWLYRSLGQVLVYNPATYIQAKFIYDWLLHIEDAPLEIMIDRFKLMILLKQDADVKHLCDIPHEDNCLSIATVACACWVMNQKRRARRLAKQGIELATSKQEPRWESAFRFLLNMK